MIIFTVIASIVSLAVWLPANSNAPIIVFAALYGLLSGCTLSMIPALVARISKVQEIGSRTGILYALSSFGALVGSPIAGAIVSHNNGGFSGLKILTGTTLVGGAAVIVVSRYYIVGWSLKKKI
jgi:MFS family permease